MAEQVIQPREPKKVHAIFAGLIDMSAVQRLSNAIGVASQNGVDEIHLLFQTTGGNVGDGICLYNIFRNVPSEIILYNVGSVASIGVVAFLGADQRKATANSAFMIHRTMYSPIASTVDRLQSAASAAALDDQRTESILHAHIKLPPEKWEIHKVSDLWLSATEALEAGLATSIGEFSPPIGQQVYYVGPI
jgi:ATP-dependent protease ClpP protease subunit